MLTVSTPELGTLTVATLVYPEEFEFLRSLYSSPGNASPRFRFPDLISACVSVVFDSFANPEERIFQFLSTTLTDRNKGGRPACRKEEIWNPQFLLLRELQGSKENRHPNPGWQLGDFTTACVALVMSSAIPEVCIFDQARKNSVERAGPSS
jgi:hypothetical protein